MAEKGTSTAPMAEHGGQQSSIMMSKLSGAAVNSLWYTFIAVSTKFSVTRSLNLESVWITCSFHAEASPVGRGLDQ